MSRMKIEGVEELAHLLPRKKVKSRMQPVPKTPETNRKSEALSKRVIEGVQTKKDPITGKYLATYTEEEINRMGEEMIEWYLTPTENEQFPFWLKDFATLKGISWKRLTSYAKTNAYFAECLEIVKDMQEGRLVQNGMTTQTSSMSIFALKNVAGYSDRKEVKTDTKVTINDTREKELDRELDEILRGRGIKGVRAASGQFVPQGKN